jgi:hypothetical protein
MHTTRRKIQKDKGVDPSKFEDSIAQVSSMPYFSLFFAPEFFSFICSVYRYMCD